METRPSNTLKSVSASPVAEAPPLPQLGTAEPEDPAGGKTAVPTSFFWVQTGNSAWAIGVMIVGLGLHFYYVREMLISFALFGLLFFLLSLVALGALFAWYAGGRVAIWVSPASQTVITFFRRLVLQAKL